MSRHANRHRGDHDRKPTLALGAVVAVVVLVLGFMATARPDDDAAPRQAVEARTTVSPTPGKKQALKATPAPEKLKIQKARVLKPIPGPVLAKATDGRTGSGLALGPVTDVNAPVGIPIRGTITTSVANIPNRSSAGGFASSLRTLTASGSDFVLLNEVSARSVDAMRAAAPGYDAYRDPARDRSTGGSQSMNNVVMWRTDRWRLIDAGRIKVVDDDRGFHSGHAFTWDRYATWATLQRIEDGAVMSVMSTHMPTNPGKFPRQPGGSGMSRIERYARGMDVLTASARTLAQHGPVLLGGDMNSHHSQGAWTAAGKMTAAGYEYVKDRGVMHLFFQSTADVVANRQVGVASDHPAIITTLDMNGLGPT